MMDDTNEPSANMERKLIDTESLARIAIFLEGYKTGRSGNILPLGLQSLEVLWDAIRYLNGDDRYIARRDGFKNRTENKVQ